MNLGAFMDPEYPIFSTTLCYLERDDAYLMLHRIKKQDDYNHDKWVGVGGKFERFESPEDCLVREVREETGLTLTRWRCRGLLTFVWGNMTEFIHLYTADGWQGERCLQRGCAGVGAQGKGDGTAHLGGRQNFLPPAQRGSTVFFAQAGVRRRYPETGGTGRGTNRRKDLTSKLA